MSLPAIGGVMPAAPAEPPCEDSVWRDWGEGWPHRAAFANARSALGALIAHRGLGCAWLPAYICGSVAEGVASAGAETRFYAVSPRLEPDFDGLVRNAAAGDAVLVVDYFGRADPGWLELRAARPDLMLIEDRAQALDTAAPALAEVVIHSPRKLLGVGDGGLIFSRDPAPQPTEAADDGLWAPQDARAADPDGRSPRHWRPLYQAAEAAMAATERAATRRTLAALAAAPLAPLAAARRANWRALASGLGDWALWREPEPSFAPLAFPVLTTDAAATVAALAEHRIWAPRHWAELPSPADAFPDAHRLAAACVSLPLDPRYGAGDMVRIAAAVRAVSRPAGAR